MDLLPRSHHDFGSKDYWEKFFEKRGSTPFEWYGSYARLCGILSKYIKTADNLLVIGCGNSDLSTELYDVGYHNIINIDISATVIKQMALKNSSRIAMQFLQMDLLQMSFEDGKFSVVLDKGTLDALFTDNSSSTLANIEKMFFEISRVLRIGGRYVCVSLGQEHILDKVIKHFAAEGWMTRVCRVPDAVIDSTETEFYLPIFIFVFTKFRPMSNMKPILEVACFDDQVQRCDTIDQLFSTIYQVQQYAWIRAQLQKGRVEEQLAVDLYCSSSNSSRYTIFVVDACKRLKKKFAIFIVPQGREMEWLFATDAGRAQLQQTAGFERLLVVHLHRDHDYKSLDDVKSELSSRVLELAPCGVGKQSPFLSVGDEINLRAVRHTGRSELSGDYVVEDVEVSGQTFRRLIFLSNKNLVQSDARLIKQCGSKRREKASAGVINIDHDTVTSNYGKTVVAGLAFVEEMVQVMEKGLQLLLIGLGGGGLSMFLKRNIPKIEVDVVEIDPAIVAVATDWFGLIQDDQLRVHVCDGIEYIKQLCNFEVKKDVIIVDVDSKDANLGMSCPPESFVQIEFLQCIHRVLKSSGVLIINLVCRNPEVRGTVVSNLKTTFDCIFSVKATEDVNETLYCLPLARTNLTNMMLTEQAQPSVISAALRILQDMIQNSRSRKDAFQLTFKLDGLLML